MNIPLSVDIIAYRRLYVMFTTHLKKSGHLPVTNHKREESSVKNGVKKQEY